MKRNVWLARGVLLFVSKTLSQLLETLWRLLIMGLGQKKL